MNCTFSEEVDAAEAKGGETGLFAALCVNPNVGLSNSQLENRRKAFGHNQKPIVETSSYCKLLWQALEDFTLRILLVAAIVSIALEVGISTPQKRKTAWIQGFAILIAVAVCANVTAANDYQKEKQFQKLNSVADSRKEVQVKRNGKFQLLQQDKLLVGDIVMVQEGMEVPADGFVFQASQMVCDQSAMTGESDPIEKSSFAHCVQKRNEIGFAERAACGRHQVPSCVMLSGTRVLAGQGKMMVIVVGENSCIGKIRAVLLQEEADQTPLQQKLESLATDIGIFGLVSAVVVFLVLMARLAAECIIQNRWDNSTRWIQIVHYFILAVTVVVVAIPQGLPLAVTLSLAYSVTKMLQDNNLVRKMEACETMGGANNICSDKTGTLTMNKMNLTAIWNDGVQEYNPNAPSFTIGAASPTYLELFSISLACNSTALLQPAEKGSSTEIALLKFLRKAGFDFDSLRQAHKPKVKFPFSSARKRMSVVVQVKGEQLLLTKGASQMVLKCCDSWHNKSSEAPSALSPSDLAEMERGIFNMAERALRTLVIAYKRVDKSTDLHSKDELGLFDVEKGGLTLLAILGVRDIPRPEVPKAIADCKLAHIKVRMVTGDNLITARAIAKEIGIIEPGNTKSIVMEGPEFVKEIGGLVCSLCLTQLCDCPKDPATAKRQDRPQRVDTVANKQKFNSLVEHLDVLARSRPQDKYALVTGLNERGDVVAVTGDGTNDAPALKRADVGFAMGIAGTEVARQASSIILLDDNFSSIVKAAMWGRNIYDSIRKFMQFQLTVNVVAVAITIVGSALLKQEVLTAIQMLWINLIMDTFASLALATQPPTEQLLRRKPQSRTDYMVSPLMLKHILGQACYQLAVLLLFTFASPYFMPQAYDPTMDPTLLSKMQTTFPARRYDSNYNFRLLGFKANASTYCFGNYKAIDGKTIVYGEVFQATGVYSRHFSNIFNVFVWMQIFNFINSRKLEDELNILGGITRNPIFFAVVGTIILAQTLIMVFTSTFFNLYPLFGPNVQQWFICIAFGAGSLLVSVLLKLIPLGKSRKEDTGLPSSGGELIRKVQPKSGQLI